MANKSITILVIDDLKDNLITLKALINDAFPKANVIQAQDGNTGLELAAKENPDIILLDIIMPGMDGYAVCQNLKADKELCDIPVVFVTAIENNKEAFVKALDSGGEAFLTKPINEIELIAQIRAMLKIREANKAKKNERVRLEKLVERRSKELVQELEAHKKTLQELRIKEAEKNSILQTAIDGFWIVDKQGKFIEVNEAACKMIGYSKAEMLEMSVQDIEANETAVETANNIKTIIKEGSARFESKHRTKNGKVIDVEVNTTWMNSLNIFFAFLNDITDRKLVEEKLEESQVNFRGIYEQSPIAIEIYDKHGKLVDVNQQTLNMFGVDDKKHVLGFDLWADPNLSNEKIKLLKSGQEIFLSSEFDFEIVKEHKLYPTSRSGKIYMDMYALPLLNKKEITGFLVQIIETTKRMEAENALKKNQQLLNETGRIAKIGGWELDVNSMTSTYTQETKKIYGLPLDADPPKGIEGIKYYPEEAQETIQLAVKNALEEGKPYDIEVPFVDADNNRKWVRTIGHAEKRDGKVVRLYGTFQDITERRKAEENLRESEERFNLAMIASNDGLFDWNLETNEIYYSPGWKKMLGYEDHELPNDFSIWEETTAPEYVKKSWELQQKLISKQIDRFVLEFKMKHKNGHWVDILSRASAIFDNEGKAIRIVGTHTDITQSKLLEQELKSNEALLNETSKTAKVGGWEINLSGQTLAWTNETFSIHELDRTKQPNVEEAINFYHPDDRSMVNELVQKTINTGEPFNFEARLITALGNQKWVLAKGNLGLINGVANSITGIIQDITERKQAEAELIKLSTAIKQSPSVIAITDTKGKLEYVNPKFTESTGYSLEEAIGQNLRILKSGEQSKESYKELWETISSGKVWHGEFHNKKKNGELFWEIASVSPIFDNQGKIVNYIKVAEDITERKQAEDNFKHSIDESPLGVRIVTQAGKTIYVNKALLDIYEFSSTEEFLNTRTIETYTEQSYQEHLKRKKIRKEGGDAYDYEISIRRKNGEIRQVKVWRKDVLWNGEKHFQVINQDITELRQLNKDLIQAKEKAEESNRLKSAFLANMSHEIRTPMNGILGFTELLKEPHLDDTEKDRYIRVIEESGNRMLKTINDIIDISKIEAGQVTVTKEEISVNKLLDEQYNFFQHEAESKGLKLVYKPGLSDTEAHLVTDKYKLLGILTNLIKNAIKFTDQGEITVSCLLKKEQDMEFLEFYVKDTGIGIPSGRIEAIFNRFEQADIEDTRVFQGSGLGLAISKSYVEMLGGHIRVTSEEGKGSTFTFKIPYTKQLVKERKAKGNINQGIQAPLNNLSIIIAEDDEASIMYFDAIFKNEFKNITYTKTGQETIDKFRENPDTDLILMDIKMPDINGYDATREIRKINSRVIIIAQTAFGLAGDMEKAIEAGCNDYIAKPTKKDKLLALIQKYFNK